MPNQRFQRTAALASLQSAAAEAHSLGGSSRRHCFMIAWIVGASIAFASVARATEDVTMLWREATFRAKTTDLGAVQIDVKTEMRKDVLYLSSVKLRLNSREVPCPAAGYVDLDFPQLETFQLVEQFNAPTQIRFKFGAHSTVLAEGASVYPEVRIDLSVKGCGGRTFLVPKAGGGTIIEKDKP